MDIKGHFNTVHEHRKLVRNGCFKVGLYYQGLTHDLSKYSPSEFLVGLKYYQGYQSPNNAERDVKGYSSAWLHHKGRNKHHYEYWIDYSSRIGGMVPVRMPDKYIVEMYMDRIAASKTYNKDKYTDAYPLEYYKKGKNFQLIEESTRKTLELLLNMLSEKGEEVTEEYIRRKLLKGNPGAFIAQMIVNIRKIKRAKGNGGRTKLKRHNTYGNKKSKTNT